MAPCPMEWLGGVLKESLASLACQRPTAPLAHVDRDIPYQVASRPFELDSVSPGYCLFLTVIEVYSINYTIAKSLDTEPCFRKSTAENLSNVAFEESRLQPNHHVAWNRTCRTHAQHFSVFTEINPQVQLTPPS